MYYNGSYVYSSKNKKRPKEKSMTGHFIHRYKERFKKDINQNDVQYIIAQIKKHNSECVYKLSNARSVHLVKFNDESIVVVYNKVHKALHTCFPESWITSGKYNEYIEKRKYIFGEC